MPVFLRILLGLAVAGIGFLFVWKTDKLRVWFGEIDWAEQHLGNGGTRLFYKLVGAGICFIGIFIATNIISDILNSFVSIFAGKMES